MTPLEAGRLILAADPQFRRVEPGRVDGLVAAALEDGAALARTMPDRDPRRLAERLGVAIVEAEAADFGTVVVVAEYRRSRITLYRAALERLAARAGVDVRPVFIAHELYHHLDESRPVPLARRHQVRILGPWRSGLRSLAEIAAGAFAQELLGLAEHPKHLDLLLEPA